MKRRRFMSMAVALALAGAPGFATPTQDEVIRRLGDEGYTHVRIGRTLLGRVRIVATSPTHRREIVLNGRTGEILRDYWAPLDKAAPSAGGGGSPSAGGASTGEDGPLDDEDEDDSRDDEDEDDSPDGGEEDEEDEDNDSDDDDDDDSDDDSGGDDEDDSDGDDEDDH